MWSGVDDIPRVLVNTFFFDVESFDSRGRYPCPDILFVHFSSVCLGKFTCLVHPTSPSPRQALAGIKSLNSHLLSSFKYVCCFLRKSKSTSISLCVSCLPVSKKIKLVAHWECSALLAHLHSPILRKLMLLCAATKKSATMRSYAFPAPVSKIANPVSEFRMSALLAQLEHSDT